MKGLDHYMNLRYTTILRRDNEGDYVARIDELPGCAAHGKTPQEALENLEEAKRLWISDCIESGGPVPEPVVEEVLPSGKWVQRVPRGIHRKLIATAKREGVSLNQFVTAVLSEALGVRNATQHAVFIGATSRDLERIWHKRLEHFNYWVSQWLIDEDPSPTFEIHDVPSLLKMRIPNRFTTDYKVIRYAYKREAGAHKGK